MVKGKPNFIAQFRKEAGFTQKSLAEALNVTDKAVSKWERGLSLPDVALLPRLSLLLGVDMSLLLAPEGKHIHEGWYGLIDLRDYSVDISQIIYDKPLVYFMLSNFLLSNVRDICVLCSEENRGYLQSELFRELGFRLSFDFDACMDQNLMILNRPCFLFGSDLTRQFHGAMVSNSVIKLTPENIPAPFLFCPAEYVSIYKKNPNFIYDMATVRTLGRGMVCIDMEDLDMRMEIGSFVKMYQKSSGLLIGSLEEIAYRKGLIDKEKLLKIIEKAPYKKQLEEIVDINR